MTIDDEMKDCWNEASYEETVVNVQNRLQHLIDELQYELNCLQVENKELQSVIHDLRTNNQILSDRLEVASTAALENAMKYL